MAIENTALNLHKNEDSSRRWIDTVISLLKTHSVRIHSLHNTPVIIKRCPPYRNEELEDVLLSLLKDASRNDREYLLILLKKLKSKKAQEIIVQQYLHEESPDAQATLTYLLDMKDPAYFDKTWQFLTRMQNSGREIEKEIECPEEYLLYDNGWYFEG